MTFEQWKAAVNREVIALCGMSCDDLSDVDFWSMHDDGESPKHAAREVLRASFGDCL